jgi:acyl-CoA thioesterase FadM
MTELNQWTEEFVVQGADADFKDRMRPSALLRYAEQTVTHQMQQYGMDDAFFQSIHAVCLLGKQTLEFVRVPRRGEPLVCTCIPERSHGGTSKRFCVVQDAAGQLVARVDSRWILVDTRSRQIIRHPAQATEAPWNETVPYQLPQIMPRAAELADGGRCGSGLCAAPRCAIIARCRWAVRCSCAMAAPSRGGMCAESAKAMRRLKRTANFNVLTMIINKKGIKRKTGYKKITKTFEKRLQSGNKRVTIQVQKRATPLNCEIFFFLFLRYRAQAILLQPVSFPVVAAPHRRYLLRVTKKPVG